MAYIIGTPCAGRDTPAAVSAILKAERDGLSAAWLTTGSGLDPVGIALAAAGQTTRIRLGTSIAHIWSMPPVKMAHLAQAVAQMTGGRFRLGLGVASASAAAAYGQTYSSPFGHLREYVHIIKTLVATGQVDFTGAHYTATAKLPSAPVAMPVMIAALNARSFQVAGEVADGAITWITPGPYLRDVAIPNLQAGAAKAGRPAPPLIAHVPVAVHDDPAEVREAVRRQFAFYLRAPHYQAMLTAAGYPEAQTATWSDRMIDGLVAMGSAQQVTEHLARMVEWGAAELLATPVNGVSEDRTLALLVDLAAR
ncbi:MAG: LLM class flavin-dependent oxidoreductase [Dehalococcoidia bacterium]|nr:LLM class flavin-dependent oxidoreductase [Dehalococcoidia bacterium]